MRRRRHGVPVVGVLPDGAVRAEVAGEAGGRAEGRVERGDARRRVRPEEVEAPVVHRGEELGGAGIRCNAVNADRVRTSLLNADDIEQRARARGLDSDAYYRSNLLKREVAAEDVAQAFVSLALAPSTTGSVLTVDGGNIAASPR